MLAAVIIIVVGQWVARLVTNIVGRVMRQSHVEETMTSFVVRPWVNTGDYWDLKFDLTEKIKLTFDENDISIPFPQHTVHMAAPQS